MKDSKVFYPARGTTKMEAQPEGHRTQYGWTSTFCGLQLHAGDHTYHKRGGLYSAFLFDKIDYRYDGLLKSLGINDVPALGCLIGRLCGQDDELIRFRITEEDPTHIVVCYDCRDVKLDEVAKLNPDAMSISTPMPHLGDQGIYRNQWIQAVFPLDRINTTDDPYVEYYDDLYDFEPDVADLYHCHASEEVDSESIILTRLQAFGF